MIDYLDPNSQIVALLLLLVLCLVTIEYCRRDSRAPVASESALLFQGKSLLHSLASNTGTIFSLTYFFGGVVLYGYFFGLGYLAVSFFILAASLVVLWKAIASFSDVSKPELSSGNILLDFLKVKLSPRDFRVMVRIYAIVYFLLLVEELAVSRLVLSKLLPGHPALSTMALGLICIVIFIYLKLGGFRAVLNSDLVQMAVIATFVLSMVYLMAKARALPDLPAPTLSQANEVGSIMAIPLIVLFGICWFFGSVDFYSRLNFMSRQLPSSILQRQRFAVVSLISIFVVISIGALFGMHLRLALPSPASISTFTESVIGYFLTQGRALISGVFVVSIFCMIFTTIDTLLLTLIQVDSYRSSRWFGRESLAKLLLVAVGLSCLIEFDLVSAFGIFAGSLMILPALGIASALQRTAPRLLPSLVPLEWALFASLLIFVSFIPLIKANFQLHHLLPSVAVFATTVAIAISKIVRMRGEGEPT